MEKAILRTLCLSLLLLSTTAFSQGNFNFNGQVTYHDNYPMTGVIAHLTDSIGNVIDSATTNNGGHYTFHNVAPGNYTITFTTGEDSGGINLTDPFIVIQRLLNLCTFTPIQELASDVDGDGTLTWDDYDLILLGYMNEGDPFPIGPWVFETASVTIPTAAREGFTTRGTSSGDSNGSLVPDPKSASIFLNNPVTSLNVGPSDPIDFKLTGAGNLEIAGMHLVIRIPEGLSVLSVESPISTAKISILRDQVRVTWIDQSQQAFEITDGMPLLVITTKTTGASRDGKSYSLKLSDESHFINANGELISGVSLILPTINLIAKKDIALTVYPNPFMENANLNYLLPGEGHVIISLFDQAGRLVQEIVNGDCQAGNHQAKINGADLIPGIYYYSIIYNGSDQFKSTGTIIKSK
ncbi:MAG: T9SS type A sorting domain-containing protein [Bacteroidales bacterium]